METKSMNAIFSENLRNRLYLKRMTQSDLAKKLNVSEASVSKWCVGDAMPRPKKIDQICILLGNVTQDEYKQKSAEIQQKIAEIQKKPPLKTKIFVSNWKDLYQELDEIHRRSFWRGLVKEIHTTVDISGFEIIY